MRIAAKLATKIALWLAVFGWILAAHPSFLFLVVMAVAAVLIDVGIDYS